MNNSPQNDSSAQNPAHPGSTPVDSRQDDSRQGSSTQVDSTGVDSSGASDSKRIFVISQQVSAADDASEQDVLVQREAVCAALRQLGYSVTIVDCTLQLQELREQLLQQRPAAVFNLVESLAGTDRLMPLLPLLTEALGVPCTGSGSRAMLLTSDKLTAKRQLQQAGLPTPCWLESAAGSVQLTAKSEFVPGQQMIFKAVHEHASFGLFDDCVQVCASREQAHERLQGLADKLGRPMFAERYIAGREVNVSLLETPAGPVCLPVAEIEFVNFAADQPRIVGYAAKWSEDSAEYQQTPRRFLAAETEAALLTSVRQLAVDSWHLFQLRGYARVDFRIDSTGQPWILEVNVNPCLSPDAGFAAALEQANLPFVTAIQHILHAAGC